MTYRVGGLTASHIATGEFANERISESSTTQHEAALEPLLQLNKLDVDADVVLGSFLIKSSSDPVAADDLVRKAFVDAAVASLSSDLSSFIDAQAITDGDQDTAIAANGAAIAAEASRAQTAEGVNAAAIAADVQALADYISSADAEHAADAQALADYIAANNAALAADVANLASLQAAFDSLTDGLDNESLDQIIEVIAAYESADQSLQDAINALSTTHTSELSAEIAARVSGDAAVAADAAALVASEAAARQIADSGLSDDMAAMETSLQANIDAEALARANADTAEASARAAADSALSDDINAVSDDLGGYITSNDAALAAEIARAQGAEVANANAISAETTRAQNAEAALQDDIAGVADALGAYETSNDAALAAEIARATAAEQANASALAAYQTSNNDALAAEIARAQAAEAVLSGRVDDVLSNVDAEAIDSFTELIAAFEAADGEIEQSVADLLATHNSEMAAVQQSVADEAARATAAEQANAAAITQEIADRQAAVAGEASARSTADAAIQSDLDGFKARTDNPHSVTATQVGLGAVESGDYSGQMMRVGFRVVPSGSTDSAQPSDYVMFCEDGATFNLPAPAPEQKGRLMVIKVGSLASGVTVAGQVDGQASYQMEYEFSAITLVCDGASGWFII